MRAQSDAVLVGAGTVRSDDPRLERPRPRDRRPPPGAGGGLAARCRCRARATSAAPRPRCRPGSATTRRPTRARRTAWEELGAELIEMPWQADGQLDLSAMMQRLGDRGLTRVLCEGGGRLAAALIEDDLVDEVVCYTAGLVLGAEAIPAVGGARGRGAAAGAALPAPRRDPGRTRPAQPLAPPGMSSAVVRRRSRLRRSAARHPIATRQEQASPTYSFFDGTIVSAVKSAVERAGSVPAVATGARETRDARMTNEVRRPRRRDAPVAPAGRRCTSPAWRS